MSSRTSLLHAAFACGLAVCPAAVAQTMPFAVDPQGEDGPWDLWLLDETSGQLTAGPADVRFHDIELVGYPRAERLRLDRPALVESDGDMIPRVRLPAGGSLYRIGLADGAAMLHVDASGDARLPLQLDSDAHALMTSIHVATDGDKALVATTPEAGGDVWLLDLHGAQPAVSLSAALPPLTVEPTSLRASPGVAWFVAGGQLYRADLAAGGDAQLVDLGLPGWPVQPELAAAAHGDAIAVVLGDDPAARMLVGVSAAGEATTLTPSPAAVQLPSYDHALGPRLALSPDGELVAWTQLVEGSLELFTHQPVVEPSALHVTSVPEFPAYIDNVGVLGFQTERRLLFLTGDTTLSGLTTFDTIGAGEMFSVDLTVPGEPSYVNVSQTGGGYEPPYLEPATLTLSEAVYDPMAQHCVVSGGAGMALASFLLYPPPTGAEVVTHLDAAEDDEALLQPLGDRMLVSSEPVMPEDDEPEDGLEVDLDLGVLSLGDPASLGLSSLLSLPDGIDVDNLVSDPEGQWIAFAAGLDSGLELPVLLHADTGVPQLPTWPLPVTLAGPLTFSSSGRLYFSVGADEGPTKLVTVTPGEPAQLVPAPKGRAFPLAH